MEDGIKHGRSNGIAHLMTQLTNIMIERNMNLMSNSLPNDDLPNLQVGVPRFAGHNLWATSVHEFFELCSS